MLVMNSLPTDTEQEPQTVAIDQAEPSSAMSARLRTLKSLHNEPEARSGMRFRIGLIIVAVAMVLGLGIFFAATIWRLHGPQFTSLKDGWFRVIDRQWGFEFEVPSWYSKNAEWNKLHYQSRFNKSYASIDLYVEKWIARSRGTTPTADLKAGPENAKTTGEVRILFDKTSDPVSPMIDYTVTVGPPNNSWTTRHRSMIHRGARIDVIITNVEYAPEGEVERVVESVHWLP